MNQIAYRRLWEQEIPWLIGTIYEGNMEITPKYGNYDVHKLFLSNLLRWMWSTSLLQLKSAQLPSNHSSVPHKHLPNLVQLNESFRKLSNRHICWRFRKNWSVVVRRSDSRFQTIQIWNEKGRLMEVHPNDVPIICTQSRIYWTEAL